MACEYKFAVTAKVVLAMADVYYQIRDELTDHAPQPDPEDVAEFASANGAYHSRPFLREVLFGLTAKMGFPAFTLPLLAFCTTPLNNPRKVASRLGSEAAS